MHYRKPATTIVAQIELLIRRGMIVRDHERASRVLSHINYYRLRAYWLPFEIPAAEGEHRFRAGCAFEDVVRIYLFDRKLRLLILEAIERVEVSLRTRWAHELAMKYGSHAHLETRLFRDPVRFDHCLLQLREELQRSRETFVDHYRMQYSTPETPPIWATCEVLTLGQLSKWLGNLKYRQDRQSVAREYMLDESILCAFAHHLAVVRNLCAHHSRVWNRLLTIGMRIPKHPVELAEGFNPDRPRNIHNTLVMLVWFVQVMSPDSGWPHRLTAQPTIARSPVHTRPW
jgi:abortive infection bacteriophage resistance protein